MDLTRRRPVATAQRQAGAATLAVAVIMLLVVSVLVFHSHAAGWLEQRATANQARAKEALAVAEAGLDAALSVLNSDSGTPSRATYLSASSEAGKFNINAAPTALIDTPGTGLSYSVTYTLVSPDTGPADRFLLTSRGGSDCSDVSEVSTCASQATVRQVVRNRGILRNPSVTPVSFENIFGLTQATVQSLTTPVKSGVGFSASTAGLTWHQGNLVLTGPVGSITNPVLLVVEGDLTVAASGSIAGFVYVTGNLTCTGCSNPSIQGAFAVAGTNSSPPVSANPAPTALSLLDNTASRFTKVIGTWRDW